jgi:hypothetical protein
LSQKAHPEKEKKREIAFKEITEYVLQELTNIRGFRIVGAEKIQEFQRKLYEKAIANPKFRFYSLYDKTYRSDILEEAYRRVKSNGGTSGVDGVTFEDIKTKGTIE